MSTFTFGATPAPSTTPAPAPSAGGFTFGAAPSTAPSTATNATTTTTPNPALAAAATASAPSSAFSFGGVTASNVSNAPSTITTTTPAPAPSTGFSFAATGSSSNGGGSGTTSSSTALVTTIHSLPTSQATIPEYESSFPFVAIHKRLERILTSLTDTRHQHQHTHVDRNGLLLNGHELIHLLSSSPPSSSTPPSDQLRYDPNLEEPLGYYLSNPQPLMFSTPNPTLRNKVLPPPTTTTTTTATTNPPNQPHTAYLTLPNHSQPTPIPEPFLRQILHLSDSLRLKEEDAAALYAEVAASSRPTGNGGLDPTRIRSSTIRTFHKETRMGGGARGNGSFVRGAVEAAMRNGTYVSSLGDSESNQSKNQTGCAGTTTTTGTATTGGGGGETKGDDVSRTAQELFCWERGYCLRTVLLLIQHRISVCSTDFTDGGSTPDRNGTTADETEEYKALSSAMLMEATDQLIQNGLITNLIRLVRDLTVQNEELRKKICTVILRTEQPPPNPTPPPATTMATSPGLFGAPLAAPVAAAPVLPPPVAICDMDYALYEFTLQQRQTAVECLFYLTYHTQCTQEEIVALIDLVRDLTNGEGGDGGGGGTSSAAVGLGSGLPILEPLRDLGGWMEGIQGHLSQPVTRGMYGPFGGSKPPEQTDRKQGEWEDDLVASLWSARGLVEKTGLRTKRSDGGGGTRWERGSFTGGTDGGGSDRRITGGKPQLLRCVTTLMLSVVCSLDGKNVLMDRDLHGPNSFGVGNALIPSPLEHVSTFQANIADISNRLDPNSERFSSWKRQDIAGFLSAAFALLLRPAASALSSPKQQSHHNQHRSITFDIKSTFQTCLETPTVTKSFTFSRLAMIPCVSTASMNPTSSDLDSDFSFYMSVLSEFTAQYLDAICLGDLPTSRAKWTQDEEAELQLRQVQEGQRQQLFGWSGQTYKEVPVPTEVDVSMRPDCLDDIIALAVAICSACPDCAMRFWSTCNTMQIAEDGVDGGSREVIQLEPSRIMRNLERVQANDPSLLPVYLSFLSAIALSEAPDDPVLSTNGAAAVHEWLSNADSASFSPASPSIRRRSSFDASNRIDWLYILNAIRWYAHELNPPQAEEGTNWGSSVDGFCQSVSSYTETEESTKYYYGAANDGTYANSQSQKVNDKSSSASTVEKKKELDESSTLTLLSLLSLLSHVALKSDLARRSILEVKLVMPGSKRYAIEDDALSILFSLLVTPITPEIRGSTLTAIANLVRCNDKSNLSSERVEQVMESARRCWDFLEQCQIIPINMLSQYQTFQGQIDTSAVIASSFVQSTSVRSKYSKVDTIGESCWFPASDQYGILNEMEHVESKKGCYPSTEGLLRLLTALISTVGCPSDLGSAWRPRPGCAPYVEFVVNFILPKAMGTKGRDSMLHFATLADKARLITRALEVIDALITNYVVPSESTNINTTKSTHHLQKGNLAHKQNIPEHDRPSLRESASKGALSLIRSHIFPSHEVNSDMSDALADFTNDKVGAHTSALMPMNDLLLSSNNGFSSSKPSPAISETAPRAKSPGFFVLADLLSPGGSLFDILVQILADDEGPNGINNLYGGTMYDKSIALALFNDTPPDFSRTSRRDLASEEQQTYTISYLQKPAMLPTTVMSLMLSLSPPTVQDFIEKPMKNSKHCIAASDDAIFWREHCILLVLRILCAAAGREDKFSRIMNLSSTSISLVPVLRFQPRVQHGSKMPLDVKNIQLARLTNRLLDHSHLLVAGRDESLIRILVQCIGYQSASLGDEEDIAAMAVSLIAYLCATTTPNHYLQALSGVNASDQAQLSTALSARLSMNATVKNSNDVSITGVILDLLLKNLGIQTFGDGNFSHIVLGLSGQSLDTYKNWLQQPSTHQVFVEYGKYRNALDTVLDLISDINFVLEPATSSLGAKCYEIIFRLCHSHDKAELSVSQSWLCKTAVISKLRNMGFWHTQLLRFLGDSHSSKSVLHTIASKLPLKNETELIDFMTLSSDSNILHSIAWLLRGTAIELHALMGFNCPGSQNQSLGGILASSAPQLSQCRRLLEILLDGPNSMILQTLLKIPLAKSSIIADGLDVDSPPREFLQNSSKALEGPADVCDGYEVIDPVRLQSELKRDKVSNEIEEATMKWAQKWNSYVSFTCAASHLSNNWGILVRALLIICEPLLFPDVDSIYPNDGQVVGTGSILGLLKSLLLRLGGGQYVGQFGQNNAGTESSIVLYNNFEQQDIGVKHELEHSIALPLCVACFTLTKRIFGNEHNVKISFDVDYIVQIISLLINAIVCCDANANGEGDFHEERAAVFSCALTTIFDSTIVTETSLPLHVLPNFWFQALRAGLYLSKLSAIFDAQYNATGDRNSVSFAARSGLACLIEFFDARNADVNKNDQFLLELFEAGIHEGKSYLYHFIQLLVKFDCGIMGLLGTIAGCCHGTELLVNAGITDGLVSASEHVESNLNRDTVCSDTYGSFEVEPPRFLSGHLSLLNSLLTSSSASPPHIQQKLIRDAIKFIEKNAKIGERLLKTYPKYANLTTQFITCVYLLSCGSIGVGNNQIGDYNHFATLTTIFSGEVMAALQRQIMDLAFHIGQYPFPSKYLALFPNALREAQNARINRIKHVKVHLRTDKCWWDSVELEDEHVTILPDPPFGSSDANFLKRNTKGKLNLDQNHMWSDHKYHIAISGIHCLDLCLLFLTNCGIVSSDALSCDCLALAQVLCRISDTLNATDIRLKRLLKSEETELPVMMDLTNIEAGDGRVSRCKRVITIEQNALLDLIHHMSFCVEKLLYLAMTQAQVFVAETQSRTHDIRRNEYASVLLSALSYTQFESKGFHCAHVDDVTNEAVQQVAKELRIHLEKILT